MNKRYITTKRHKGRVSQLPQEIKFMIGDLGIMSLENGRIPVAQINSVILTLKRTLPEGARIIPRIYAEMPITKKPLEVRMGKGKGSIETKIARVRSNSMLFEINNMQDNIPSEQYIEALNIARSKIALRTRVVWNVNRKLEALDKEIGDPLKTFRAIVKENNILAQKWVESGHKVEESAPKM